MRLPILFLLLAGFVAPASAQQPIPALDRTDPVAPPAGSACGLVSAATPPPQGMDLFPARLMRINDDNLRFKRLEYRLQPGRHVLVVAEAIPLHRLGSAQKSQVERMQQGRKQLGYFKPLIVEIRPDRLYRIGVQLRRDQLDAAGIRANAYWEPVVWEEDPRACN